MLKYALYPNRLTGNGNDFRAVPQSLENSAIEDVIRQITIPGSILKETECVAVIHEFFRIISENLRNGKGFVSEYIRIQPSISGVFHGEEDQFDSNRHEKNIKIAASRALKKAVDQMSLEKVSAGERKPAIASVFDYKTGQYNTVMTAGHMIELQGSRLKLDLSRIDEGIFLTNKEVHSEQVIRSVHDNYPSRLTFMLPEILTPGTYLLEVRNRQRNNKQISTGAFLNELTVQ